jgi:hypothetical protein
MICNDESINSYIDLLIGNVFSVLPMYEEKVVDGQ